MDVWERSLFSMFPDEEKERYKMILFIVIAIGILIYTTFGQGSLIDLIKKRKEYNKDVEQKIKYGATNFDTISHRKYDKRDYTSILKIFRDWILCNIVLNIINLIVIFVISVIVVWVCPIVDTEYSFNINALKDNMVTSGVFYSRRGYIDGEINYYFSRTMSEGEKIGHIPANKSYIKYSNEEKPHIEVHKKVNEIPKWASKMFWTDWLNWPITDYYVIVVPEGTISITGNYEIDME